MARKRKKRDEEIEEEEDQKQPHLKRETLRGIWAILFFFLTILLLLSAFDKAGKVGVYLFKYLEKLLGVGYFLLPLIFVLVGISVIRDLGRKFSWVQMTGSVIFVASGLGLIDTLFPRTGGLTGGFISTPLIRFFDVYATVIGLTVLLAISTLVIFDLALTPDMFKKLGGLLGGKKKTDETPETLTEKEAEAMTPEKTKEEAPEETEVEEETLEEGGSLVDSAKKLFGKKKDPLEDGLPIGFADGIDKPYVPPPLSLLEKDKGKPGVGDIKANANIIKRTLQNFGIDVEMNEISIGPTVTRYALKPAEGVKLSKIVGLQNDLSLALAAHPIRIEAPIPGRSLVGIEIPNTQKAIIGLHNLLSSPEFQDNPKPLLFALGRGVSGQSHYANLAKMPHLLIAGATGSGKSVTIHTILTSLLYRNSPESMKFIMIDPKRVELTLYNKIPHLLTPVITEPKKTILALKWAAKEMDRRYDILESESVRDIDSYHKNILEPAVKKAHDDGLDDGEELPDTMPYIVIVIDELADIMQAYPRELEAAIVRLAQMSRAVGIHLILSTQRPSVNVITGLIKANVPARVALQVASQVDSRTILDTSGAEKLLGAGDMLFMSGEMSKPTRIQSAYISEEEVKKVVGHLAKQYIDEVNHELDLTNDTTTNPIFSSSLDDQDDDPLYEEAREIVVQAGKASTSYMQRKLRVGYARAARLMDILEERGVIGPADGSKPRDVLMKSSEEVYGAPDAPLSEPEVEEEDESPEHED